MLRVKNGTTAGLASAVRDGTANLNYNGRTEGPKRRTSSAMSTTMSAGHSCGVRGGHGSAVRVLVREGGAMRQHQVGVARKNNARSTTGRKLVEYVKRERNTGLKLSLIAGGK